MSTDAPRGPDDAPDHDAPDHETSPDAADEDVLRLAREIAKAYQTGTTAPAARRPRRPLAPRREREQRGDAIPVSSFLGDLVKQNDWEDRLAATRVFTDWAAIVGPQIAQHCTVEHFSDGIVHVRTTSTAWARELTLLAPRLVAKLNEELGQGTVLRVEARGPQAPSWKSGRRSVKGRGPRDTYG